jgi:hypothetical protein
MPAIYGDASPVMLPVTSAQAVSNFHGPDHGWLTASGERPGIGALC